MWMIGTIIPPDAANKNSKVSVANQNSIPRHSVFAGEIPYLAEAITRTVTAP